MVHRFNLQIQVVIGGQRPVSGDGGDQARGIAVEVIIHIRIVARDPRLLAVEGAEEHVVGVVLELLLPGEEDQF